MIVPGSTVSAAARPLMPHDADGRSGARRATWAAVEMVTDTLVAGSHSYGDNDRSLLLSDCVHQLCCTRKREGP